MINAYLFVKMDLSKSRPKINREFSAKLEKRIFTDARHSIKIRLRYFVKENIQKLQSSDFKAGKIYCI